MNTLPNELILTIFDNLSISDKRIFIRISKTYFNTTKQSMSKIKYVIFKSTNGDHGFIVHNLWCVCDTLIDFRICLDEYLTTQSDNNKKYIITKKNKNILRPFKGIHEFIIEETIINNFIKF